MLAINTNSFHYRYYCWVRRMLGLMDEPKTTSLCPYCQTMLWGSIFCVFAAPGIVTGWIFMKLGRILCKFQNPVTDKVIEILKSQSKWIERLDKGPTDFSESPVITGLLFTFFGITMIICIALVIVSVGTILGLLGYGAWNIMGLAVALFDAVAWILATVFMIFYWFGFVFHGLYSGVVWLFTNGPLWYTIGSWAVWLLAWTAGIGLACLALCVLFIGMSKLSFAQRLGKFLTNKFNGYGEAQEERKLRRAEAIKKLPPWKCKFCKYNSNPSEEKRCVECHESRPKSMPVWAYAFAPLLPIGWILAKLLELHDKVRRREIDIIGPLGILWTYIVAMKRGVCPIVEFVDSVQLQSDAQASAQQRMDREARAQTKRGLQEADDTSLGAELLDEVRDETPDKENK